MDHAIVAGILTGIAVLALSLSFALFRVLELALNLIHHWRHR